CQGSCCLVERIAIKRIAYNVPDILPNGNSMSTETIEQLDISEKGRRADGTPISSDRRMFMQLLAFGDCPDTAPLIDALVQAKVDGVLYEDVNDPRGVALLTMSEDPDY